MRALTVTPGERDSLRVEEVPEPVPGPDELLVDGIAVGVCGTDREIVDAEFGQAPPDRQRLIIGHESLGRVRQAPDGADLAPGDLVVGVVRRPDPEPCGACARGYFDMCRNGRYTERGIQGLDGYASQSWTLETDYAVRLDPSLSEVGMLLEPTSVVAKAWDQIERIGNRSWFDPKTVLITGAGPIGLLAALIGVQRGLEVHVLDRVTGGPKVSLVQDLGAEYHNADITAVGEKLRPDIVIEATGVDRLVCGAMAMTAEYGIVCLTGVSSPGRTLPTDLGMINRSIVLENDAVFGSVNANLSHYTLAAEVLASADAGWLERLITRRLPLDRFAEAFEHHEDDVKVVIDLTT
ncbi:glucose 1-dehydrogenase [Actinoalloteichus hymeniacidonis]|uniref:Theronine dehydrogenase-like Zn-dependent dehydrogenase n=1 Tax=Actinoalloteichus hymeniacidonis TaxID=340345 RepID=A0AAC9HRV2_9PSEU|nr:glucose 1-dehydrogenase [Actinoalloteichus hymeniacidonis]AOS64278.1 theronine dehydrogenase-like Zn-dependent dehydrogenase [Actinoalloteichus hymeniacidonis]MBB5907654.1 threonine dehydrogenase-like Zn-dependent dehydrogenase [Actinoalloteichus hymeniacidonis]